MWCSTQSAHGVRDALAPPYGLDEADVRVVAPDVGGGFGAKIGRHPEDLLLPWLARRCGRPVRWVETRSENMLAMVQGRAQVQDVDDRRPPRRHDRGLPPRRSCRTPAPTRSIGAILPCLTRIDGGRHLRDPEGRVARPGGGHQHHARRRLPRRGPARGGRRHRAGRRPVRRRGRAWTLPRCGGATCCPRSTSRTRRPAGATYDCGDYPAALERGPRRRRLRRPARRAARRRAAGRLRSPSASACRLRRGHRRAVGRHRVRPGRGPAPADATAAPTVESSYTGTLAPRPGPRHRVRHAGRRRARRPDGAHRVVHGDTDLVARGGGTFGSRSLQLGRVGRARAPPSSVVDEARQRRRRAARGAGRRRRARRRPRAPSTWSARRRSAAPWADVAGARRSATRRRHRAGRRARLRRRRSRPTRSAPTWPSSRSTPRPARSGCCAAGGVRRRRPDPQPAARRGPAPRRPGPGRGPGAVRGGRASTPTATR